MKENTFKKNIQILEEAFRVNQLTERSINIYWEFLKNIPDEDFPKICEKIIITEKFFPAISTIKDFQLEYFPTKIYLEDINHD